MIRLKNAARERRRDRSVRADDDAARHALRSSDIDRVAHVISLCAMIRVMSPSARQPAMRAQRRARSAVTLP